MIVSLLTSVYQFIHFGFASKYEDTVPAASTEEEPHPYYIPSDSDVREAHFYLEQFLPFELANVVLDAAEYWPCMTLDHKTELVLVEGTEKNENNASTCFAFPSPPPPAKVRRVRFTLTSHDQGWGGDLDSQGSYEASHTWFEASIVRDMVKPMPVGVVSAAEVDSWAAEVAIKNSQDEGRWLIQKNVQADFKLKTHEVVWSRGGTGSMDSTLTGSKGCGTGEGFVDMFKAGDTLVVIARAQHVGWRNYVYRIEVEMFYHV